MPPTPRLSAELIVDVAVRQLRAMGYDRVSMRSIANELGTGPASLYAHVSGRDELDELILDRVSAVIHIPDPEPTRWQDQIREVARATLAAYREHPGVAKVSVARIPVRHESLVGAERLLGILLAGGVEPQPAAWFIDVLMFYVSAAAVEEQIWAERPGTAEEIIDTVRSAFGGLDPGAFPNLSRYTRELTSGGGDARFEFGLDLLLAGLAASPTAATATT